MADTTGVPLTKFRILHPTRCTRLIATALVVMTPPGSGGLSHAATLPRNFDANAKASIGHGLQCVVENVTDADGMNGRAWVTAQDVKTHKVRWATAVPLDKNWYQNQATHCLSDGSRVLAVIQSDTMSEAATAQTFVEVATFDVATGHLDALDPVKIHGFHGAASMRVDNGEANFRLIDGKPVVKGQYFILSNRDDIKPFSASPALRTTGTTTEGK